MNKKACNYAIYLLSLKDYSSYKIRAKLKSQKYPDDEIEEVLNYLIEKKYLREDEYKKIRIKQILRKGYSNKYISQSLNQEELSATNDEINEMKLDLSIDSNQMITELIDKKLRNYKFTDFEKHKKQKERIIRFLLSKGYHYSDFSKIVNLKLSQIHQIPDSESTENF